MVLLLHDWRLEQVDKWSINWWNIGSLYEWKIGVFEKVQPWSFYENNMRIKNSEAKKIIWC